MRYTLFRRQGFRQPIIEPRGTGRVEHEPDLVALGVGDQVSSSRLEPDV
jgi:hypothetical protein